MGLSNRWLRWWYLSIGAGFLLLGVRALLLHDQPVKTGLRFVIGAGFLVLGFLLFRHPSRVGRGER